AVALHQPQADAGAQQPLQGVGLDLQSAGEVVQRSRALRQAVKDAQRQGGKQDLGAAKGVKQVQDRRRVGRGCVLHGSLVVGKQCFTPSSSQRLSARTRVDRRRRQGRLHLPPPSRA